MVRIGVFVVPIGLSVFVTAGLSRLIPRPAGIWPSVVWWGLIATGGTAVLYTADLLIRRLLPLAALFKLTLVFPDRAPTRFGVALRTGTSKQLAQRLADAGEHGLGDTPQEAAETLLVLVAALSVHDRLTRGHCERVRAYTDLIAKELGLSPEDTSKIHWAAMIHDIGKLEVPAEILSKPTHLTDEEFEIIKIHPEAGARLAAPLRGWLGEWFHAIDQHHERWDGQGYPKGLAGEEISLAARIVSVADVFDVITAARSYKKPRPAVEARAELARCAGTQLDPVMVRAFLNVGLGKMRRLVGPLAWLSELPVIGRVPVTPAAGTVVSAIAAVVATALGGLLNTQPADPAPAPPVVVALAQASVPAAPSAPPAPPAPAPRAPETALSLRSDELGSIDLRALGGWPADTTVRLVGSPSAGTAELDDTTLLYQPPPGFSGTVDVTYEACNLSGCNRATVTITITAVLRARYDRATTTEDVAVSVPVLSNDTGHGTLTLVEVTQAARGMTSVTGRTVRYVPAPDSHGTDTFTYTVSDATGARASATATVVVATANDAPVAADDAFTIAEDGSAIPIDVLANDTDPDGDPLSISGHTTAGITHGTLTRTARAFLFRPAPDAHGTDTFTYTVSDGAGGTAAATVTITITSANDDPVAVDDTLTISEDGPPTPIDVLANDTDPDGDPLAMSGHTTTGITHGTLALQGSSFTYTPSPDASGTDTFTYTVSDGAGGRATASVTIRVTPVNDAPTFTIGGPVTTAEDGGAQIVPGWVTAVSPGPADESAQTVSFTVTTDDPGLFAFPPAVAADGTLTYTPAADEHGAVTLTVTATDSGGATSAAQTATLTVTSDNDAPTFTVDDVTTAEDSGAHTVPGWVTAVSPGPADESAQTVSFTVTTDGPGLFAVQPAVAADGTLTYTPAADANGAATLTVTATDSGGAGSTRTVTLTVTPVNDAPTFTIGGPVTTAEDSGAQIVPGWVTAVSPGPADESAQTVSFTVTTDDPGLFAFPPAVAADGTLTYTPAADEHGAVTLTVTATDSGGATSAAQTATLTVTSDNDPPVAVDDAYVTPKNTALVVPASSGLLANDSDIDGDSLTVTAVSAADGSVTWSPDGSFAYTPLLDSSTADTLSYTITDGNGAFAGATATVTIDAPPIMTATHYLRPASPSSPDWVLGARSTDTSIVDYDADGSPGLTIQSSSGNDGETSVSKYRNFDYAPAKELVLNGPITVRLVMTTAGLLAKDLHPHIHVQSCLPNGSGCTTVVSGDAHVNNWSLLSNWTERSFTLGPVSTTIPTGRILRVKILNDHNDMWLAMSASSASRVDLTLG